jgi:hypothetical protein
MSRNSGASISWNPKGLSRPVAGKLYLLIIIIIIINFPPSPPLPPPPMALRSSQLDLTLPNDILPS